jgi:uncharacterized caspase-like protein
MSVQPKLLVLGLLLLLSNLIFAQNTKSIKVGEYSTTIKDKRLALVIGNNEYNEVSKLSNPVEDARAIKTALEACGFEVMTLENGTEKSIKEKVREFSEKLKTNDVGMFYYSGHGVELNGINYIVPTDIVRNATAADIAEECVSTDFILKKMGEAGEVNKTYIMVLDACRNNPFKNIFKDLSAETWKQPTVVPSGSITCFAASQGEKAIEGHLHSPYTELFLKHINTPGLKIEDLFKRIRIDLIELRKNNPQINQEPVEMNKLTTEFYFVPLNNKKPDPQPNEINSATARLKISSNSSGTLKIDGQNRGQIQKDEVLILELTAGEFILQFIPENGSPIKRNVSLSEGQTKVESFEVMAKDSDADKVPDNNTNNTSNTNNCKIKTKDNSATIIYNYPNQSSDQKNIGPCYNESNFSLTVYNRWGQILYKKNNLNANWDGRDEKTGKLLEDGVYYFLMEANSLDGTNIVIRGDLTIIRNQ